MKDSEGQVPSPAPALTDEQRAELDYRMARYEQNPSKIVFWEDIEARSIKNQ